jgi:hypothetical protein
MSSSLNEPSLRMQVVNLQTGEVSIEQVPISKMVTAKKRLLTKFTLGLLCVIKTVYGERKYSSKPKDRSGL